MRMLAATIILVFNSLAGWVAVCEAATTARQPTNIPAQALRPALQLLSKERNIQVVFRTDVVSDLRTAGASGEFTVEEALQRLLKGTGLTYRYLDDQTVTIERAVLSSAHVPTDNAGLTLARLHPDAPAATAAPAQLEESAAADQRRAAATREENSKGIPEMLVEGSRSANADIERTEDDVQPYVVFSAEDIKRSTATDLESFLKGRLPMNQVQRTESQQAGQRGGQSSINLRGLGADETLILVNGRRLPNSTININSEFQPDINGIPMSAVERIEILPSTAGGIYGGNATGGVVNIILKSDYQGLEAHAAFSGTQRGGGARRSVEASGGFSLEGGRTNIMMTASYRGSNPLQSGDRNFVETARRLLLENNDGDYAVFGTDPPLGYTTNIRSTDGSDLVLKSNSQSLGYPIAHVPAGYAGPSTDGGAAFLATAGTYDLDQSAGYRGGRNSLEDDTTRRSVSFSVRREFTDRIEAFVDASFYGNRGNRYVYTSGLSAYTLAATSPANPFDNTIRIEVPLAHLQYGGTFLSLSERRQVSAGAIIRLPRGWTLQPEYTWARSSVGYEQSSKVLTTAGTTAFTSAALNPFVDVNMYPMDFSPYYFTPQPYFVLDSNNVFKNATLRVAGPVWQLPAGDLILSTFIERREQFTEKSFSTEYETPGTAVYEYYPPWGSTNDSVYVEATAPLVSSVNARPWVRGLDVQASYRFDRTDVRHRGFSDSRVDIPSPDGPFPYVPSRSLVDEVGQYTLGFKVKPVESLALRASYGEGVLSPSVTQLAPTNFNPAFLSFIRNSTLDPKRNSMPSSSLQAFSFAGSFDLLPEESESWSAGLIYTPHLLRGLRLSLDYTRIRKTNEIGAVPVATMLAYEDMGFQNRITRGPLTAADEALGYTGGPILEIDNGNVNIARSSVDAYDVQADYVWETDYGTFAANLLATYQRFLKQQVFVTTPELDLVGYDYGPLKWRGNGGVTWTRGPWAAGWNMQYYHSYFPYQASASAGSIINAVRNQGSARIPSQVYHDVYIGYRFEGQADVRFGMLDNTEIQISVENLFDTMPPIVAGTFASGGYSPYGDPRLRSYEITLSKSFH